MKDAARRKDADPLRPRRERFITAAYPFPLFGAFVSNFLAYYADAYGATARRESTDCGN